MSVFGINSAVLPDKRLKNGYTMYDWVMRKNCFPAFWGVTLLGENAVTQKELDYLRQKHCKLALVIRDLTEAGVSTVSGAQDAHRAVEAARALGVPQNEGIALFAEIGPDWSINHNWMISFAATLQANGYVAGFIGNTDSSKNFNFDRQCSHYVEATQAVDGYGALYWATEPKRTKPPEDWEPYCPSAMQQEDMDFWQCGTIRFDELEVHETYAREAAVLAHLWDIREKGIDE